MPMPRNILLGALALLLIAAGVFSYVRRPVGGDNAASSTPTMATTSATLATSTTDSTSSSARPVSVEGRGAYTIQVMPAKKPASAASPPTAPDYKAPLAFAASVNADERRVINARLDIDRADIVKDAYDISAWIDLGNLHLRAGDYDGARVIWEYVSGLWPSNIVSFNNLGDLYMSYLHNYGAAEANYLKQIQIRPDDTNAYRMLFTLYSQLYKQNTTAAEDILKKGIAANPSATDLQALLDEYRQSRISH